MTIPLDEAMRVARADVTDGGNVECDVCGSLLVNVAGDMVCEVFETLGCACAKTFKAIEYEREDTSS